MNMKLTTKDDEILCPKCGSNHNHLKGIISLLGRWVDNSDAVEGGVRLKYLCESGHLWSLVLEPYKGRVVISAEFEKELSTEEYKALNQF